MGADNSRPLVGVAACRKFIKPHYYHAAGEKYLTALVDAAALTPVILPALDQPAGFETILGCCNGILLTGSPSNVEPHHYDGGSSRPGTLHDPHRDATTLELIPAVIRAGIPLLGICRGFQEINVAYGGSLHQNVHEEDEMHDHRENPDQPLEVQYGPAHEVELVPGGMLSRLCGRDRERVNSIHHQGIERVGRGLTVEARAPDGLVEAFTVTGAPGFTLAVQWHPEWRPGDNPFYSSLFQAFGSACRQYARSHGAVS